MMDAHEITEDELRLTKAEAAVLRSEPPDSLDPHNIKWHLMGPVAAASAIAKFGKSGTRRRWSSSAACNQSALDLALPAVQGMPDGSPGVSSGRAGVQRRRPRRTRGQCRRKGASWLVELGRR